MNARFQLEGIVAIVTAAGSGIGQATSRVMTERGAKVLGVDINEKGLAETAELIGAEAAFKPCVADVLTTEGAQTACAAALAEFGGFQVLANIVGGGHVGPTYFVNKALHEFSEEEWDGAIRFNLTSAFLMCRAALPHMLEAGRGSIVNISSAASIFAIGKTSPYAAAKGGIIAMTQTMALDYADRGIRVNGIAPGPTLTPLMLRVRSPEEIAKITQFTMLQRGAEPTEMATAIAFLASDDSSYITGEIINTFGGLRAGC